MSYLACLPLIAADLPAVLTLDQRCLGGLWTQSGYQRELDSDSSDLRVLVCAPSKALIERRRHLSAATNDPSFAAVDPNTSNPNTSNPQTADSQTAKDPTASLDAPMTLLGSGCLWAILEEAHITTLAIEPNYQGQKLGLLLLSDLLACAQQRGLTRATLEVRAANQKALKLYQKFAFKEAGQRKRYYADGENARILWRNHLQGKDCQEQVAQHRESAIAYIETHHQHTVLTENDLTKSNLAEKDIEENISA